MELLMTQTNSDFSPRIEPAKSIYAVLVIEQENRKHRTTKEWIEKERDVVFKEAIYQSHKLGLRTPTFEEIMKQENLAIGHIDYASKWAIGIANLMIEKRWK
jgi:hypothetical protein